MHREITRVSRPGDRAANQDRSLAVERADCALLLLADGMGGHPRGELAVAAERAAHPASDNITLLACRLTE